MTRRSIRTKNEKAKKKRKEKYNMVQPTVRQKYENKYRPKIPTDRQQMFPQGPPPS